MKKILSMMLCCILLVSSLALTGCSQKKISNDADTLEIYAVDAGYGLDWLKEIIANFEKANQGCKVNLWSEKGETGRVKQMLTSGPKNTTTDLFFTTEKLMELASKGSKGLSGYDNIFADLTDIYNAKVPGEDITLGDKMNAQVRSQFTVPQQDKNGEWSDHYYFTSWGASAGGLVTNATLLKERGYTAPRTTDELIALAKKEKEAGRYALVCSIGTSYWEILMQTWWAQYDTITSYNNYWQGKTPDGEYSADIFKTKGRLYNLMVLDELEKKSNGYMDPMSQTWGFTDAQAQIVSGNGLFIPCGDWFQNEMKDIIAQSNPKYEFSLLKAPVISALSEKLSYWKMDVDYETAKSWNAGDLKDYDAKLAQIVEYVDNGGEKPGFATDEDIKIVSDARKILHSLAGSHTVSVPAYSNAIPWAKKFIQYMATDEANKIFIKATKGGSWPYQYDVKADKELYNSFDQFTKDRFAMWENPAIMSVWANTKGYFLLGINSYMGTTMFYKSNDADYKSPKDIWTASLQSQSDYEKNLKSAGLI